MVSSDLHCIAITNISQWENQRNRGRVLLGFREWFGESKARQQRYTKAYFLQSWTKVLRHFCISGAFSNSHVPYPFSHPSNNVGRMYPKFFPSFNFVWVGGGTNEEKFEKVVLFYEGTQILQKITNTALLSQGLLSRIVGTINYFLE